MKKFLSLILALTLMASLAVPVFAAETAEDFTPETWSSAPDVLPDPDDIPNDEAETETEIETEADVETETEALADDLMAAVLSFSDVPTSHQFYQGIMDCASKGITNGYKDGTFQPTAPVTNAQFLVMLSRGFFPTQVESWAQNSLAAKNAWWWPNWKAMNAAGILSGNSTFANLSTMTMKAGNGISRYDMAWLMASIMKYKGFTVSTSQKNAIQSKIPDYKNIPSTYQDAVKTVYALGIITGYKDGSFNGNNTMNRGQGCIVIYRMQTYVPTTAKPSNPVDDGNYDDGKPTETKPSTPTQTPNTGNNNDTGNTSKPETETKPAAGTVLRDGSVITEANVTRILKVVMAQFPGEKWTANSSRKSSTTFEGRELGAASQPMRTITLNTHKGQINHDAGCGGLATMASDAIFGGYGNGGNAFPARKTTLANARPGDIYLQLIDDKIIHVGVVIENHGFKKVSNGRDLYEVVIYDGGGNGGSTNNTITMSETPHPSTGKYNEVWTRYPA